MKRDAHMRRGVDDYATALSNLFPQGLAWPRHSDAVLTKLIKGLAGIFAYMDDRAADLLETESDPRKTTEMIDRWEEAFGLPDECLFYPPTTLADRRVALVDKIIMLGRQDRAFFIALAAKHGLTIKIREYSPYMCGISRVGPYTAQYGDDPYQPRWGLGSPLLRFHWQVNIDNVLTGVECVLRRYKPAHTEVVFIYTNVLDRKGSTYPWLGI